MMHVHMFGRCKTTLKLVSDCKRLFTAQQTGHYLRGEGCILKILSVLIVERLTYKLKYAYDLQSHALRKSINQPVNFGQCEKKGIVEFSPLCSEWRRN